MHALCQSLKRTEQFRDRLRKSPIHSGLRHRFPQPMRRPLGHQRRPSPGMGLVSRNDTRHGRATSQFAAARFLQSRRAAATVSGQAFQNRRLTEKGIDGLADVKTGQNGILAQGGGRGGAATGGRIAGPRRLQLGQETRRDRLHRRSKGQRPPATRRVCPVQRPTE